MPGDPEDGCGHVWVARGVESGSRPVATEIDHPTHINGEGCMEDRINRLLETARTIAVVGMSNRPFRDSYRIGSFLQEQGYRVYPVNPTIESAAGIAAVPDLASVPERIDIVDVFRNQIHATEIVREAIAVNAGAIWFQLGTEDGEAIELAYAAGLDVVYGRCIAVEYRTRGVDARRVAKGRSGEFGVGDHTAP